MQPGDELFGSITYDAATSSYNIYHNSSDGWEVTTNIPVQKKNGVPKTYQIAYFVYEKVAPCADYPPEELVTFYDVNIQWDGVAQPARWSTAFVEDVCNFRAHVPDPSTSGGNVTITWSTAAPNPKPELIAASQADRQLGRVPAAVARTQRA